jgi:hypothetical protein
LFSLPNIKICGCGWNSIYVPNLELGEAEASLYLSHKESRSKFREDKWVRINCWDHAWGSGLMDFHCKGDVAHVRTSKTLAFWRRRNNKFTASTIKPRFAFDF